MKISFQDLTRTLSSYQARMIKRAVRCSLHSLPRQKSIILTKLPRVSISISVVGVFKMREINQKYRNKNYPTDVLSFSRLEDHLMPGAHIDIGDIVICLPIAKKQAVLYHESLRQELERLTVHGVLHLFGYDHEISKKEERKMFSLQNKILKLLSNGTNDW